MTKLSNWILIIMSITDLQVIEFYLTNWIKENKYKVHQVSKPQQPFIYVERIIHSSINKPRCVDERN